MIGSLGDVVFEVTPDSVRTIAAASRATSPRWATKDVHLQKQSSEFLGPSIDEMSITVEFREALGVTPEEEADRIRELGNGGRVLPFMLGESWLGDFYLTHVGESWSRIRPNGSIGAISVQLTLKEYAE